MKIAVTYENGQVFQHFGHTPAFKVYDIQNGKIVSAEVIDATASGHGALAGFLLVHDVEALICGGIGPGAQQALASVRIALYAGISGSADEAAQALAEGRLAQNAAANCGHHAHGEGHDCADHHCGEHHCGHGCH